MLTELADRFVLDEELSKAAMKDWKFQCLVAVRYLYPFLIPSGDNDKDCTAWLVRACVARAVREHCIGAKMAFCLFQVYLAPPDEFGQEGVVVLSVGKLPEVPLS